ncbi:hypothetical protein Bca52824_069871 [Brassica carinata]|uniref:Multiple C2 domain-containing protein n=1 Tax=Brassica carinata TaxID=52824 RepID=A0A8X7Q433_BRACI|nr:hypothetical protein Bca52824_069871 [Brassica carinata]
MFSPLNWNTPVIPLWFKSNTPTDSEISTLVRSNWNMFLDKSMENVVLFAPNNIEASPVSLFLEKSIWLKSTLPSDLGIEPESWLCDKIRYGSSAGNDPNDSVEVYELAQKLRNRAGEVQPAKPERTEILKLGDGVWYLTGDGDDAVVNGGVAALEAVPGAAVTFGVPRGEVESQWSIRVIKTMFENSLAPVGLWNFRFMPRHPPHMDTKISCAEAASPDELDRNLTLFRIKGTRCCEDEI